MASARQRVEILPCASREHVVVAGGASALQLREAAPEPLGSRSSAHEEPVAHPRYFTPARTTASVPCTRRRSCDARVRLSPAPCARRPPACRMAPCKIVSLKGLSFTGWFDDTFPCSVDTNPSDRARSRRAPAFPYIMCTLWMVADHENHTSHRSYPAHEHTRLETHQSDQLTYSNYDNGHGTVRPSMSYEQVPRAAASGGVREARGGSLHAASRAPAS